MSVLESISSAMPGIGFVLGGDHRRALGRARPSSRGAGVVADVAIVGPCWAGAGPTAA